MMYMLIAVTVTAGLLIIGWCVLTSNRFQVMLIKIKEAESGIDVALTKRYDTLTKLMDVVKAYTKHETELFTQVIKLRQGMSMAEKNEVNQRMDELVSSIYVVAENYPQLRSSENYKQLQDAILDAEDHLQAARRVYNMNVSSFNQLLVVFPASIIANAAHHRAQSFFQAEQTKRKDVKMDL